MESQRRQTYLKAIVGCLWLAVVSGIIYALTQQSQFFARSIPAVAEVAKVNGSVSFRSEGKVRWNEAANGTVLADGDRVATGKSSTVDITFVDGRTLKVSEDTQIIISTITHSDSGLTFLINLVKGAVVADARKTCSTCRDIIVRAGGESFTVAKGSRSGYFRDGVAGKIQTFKAHKPAPKQTPNLLVEKQVPTPEVKPSPEVTNVIAKPVSKPKPPSPAAKVAQALPSLPLLANPVIQLPANPAAGHEFSIRPPVEGQDLWTDKPLARLFDQSIAIPLVKPTTVPKSGSYVPLLEITDMANSRKEVVAARSSTDSAIDLSLVRLRTIATQQTSGVKRYQVKLRGGIRVTEGAKSTDSFAGIPLVLSVTSLAEVSGAPLVIGFDDFGAKEGGGGWIPSKRVGQAGMLPVQVTLLSQQDVSKFVSNITGAQQVHIASGAPTSSATVNIVRNNQIIAQVNRYRSVDDIKKIVGTLGASFAFRGLRDSYHFSAGGAQDNVVSVVDDLLDKGRVIYFYKNKRLYPVSRSFIRDSKEVAKFLGQQASLYFTEKVELID